MAPCRLWYPYLVVFTGFFFTIEAQRQGKTLTCVCTTSDCETLGVNTCNTTHLCYTQILERADGSGPVIRGCITNRSPILCENRPPATKGKWPLLLCCNSSMCNQLALPTQPAWHIDKGNVTSAVKLNTVIAEEPITSRDTTDASNMISPIYITVLVVGIGLLLVLAGVAAIVLRRHTLFYRREFGIDRRSYLKGQDLASVSRLQEPDSSRNGFYNDSKAILAT
uniref:Activin types I and II receptor domain-containing protein n=1 Tax=Strigamia maritima TaxID=126957 RepID=T1J664_STRMM